MDKKAQVEMGLEDLGRLIFKIISIIFLLVILGSIVALFFTSGHISNEERDLLRIKAEIIELRENEAITLPIISSDSTLLIRNIDQIISLNIKECKINKGDYCICIVSTQDEQICDIFYLNNEGEVIPINAQNEIDLGSTLTLSHNIDSLSIS